MKKNVEQVTTSAEQTIALAKKIAKGLRPGTVVALEGNLGAGKTTFIKGLALGLGLKNPDEVKSPTFALMHTYPTSPVLYHFDLYRLEGEKEISNIGLEDFMADPSAITCIEWPKRGASLLPKEKVTVKIVIKDQTKRKIQISYL